MENSIKINKPKDTHVLFSSLDIRQLELLTIFNTISEISMDKEVSNDKLGQAVRSLLKQLED